eukprot:RCo020801
MGGACSFDSIRLTKASHQDEFEEEEDDLLPPHTVLIIQRWLKLVQEQCKPSIDELEHSPPPAAEETDDVLSAKDSTSAMDEDSALRSRERSDSLSIINVQNHVRLLQQQDRASGGAPPDGSFRIIATPARKRVPGPGSPPAVPAEPTSADRVATGNSLNNSVAPSCGTELVPMTSTMGIGSRNNSSLTPEPCMSPGVRITAKRGNFVASEDPAPASLLDKQPTTATDVDVDEVAS